MPLLPWQRHPFRRLPLGRLRLGRLPWQRETSAPDPQLAHSGLACPTAIHYARVPPKVSPETPLKAISGGIRRRLTGLCQPAPDHCPDNPLLSCFAAPLNVRDEGGCYGFEVELSGFDAKQISVFARGQRLLVCGQQPARDDDAVQRRLRAYATAPTPAPTPTCDDTSGCTGCEAGQLMTSLTLPGDADLPNLSASFHRGSLAVRVPKHGPKACGASRSAERETDTDLLRSSRPKA